MEKADNQEINRAAPDNCICWRPIVFLYLPMKRINRKFLFAIFILEVLAGSVIGLSQNNISDTSRMIIHADRIRLQGKIELAGSEKDLLEIIKLGEHSVQAVNVSICLPQNLFSFRVDSISFDQALGKISLTGVKMLPHYSKEEFHKHAEYETDRIEADIKSIVATGFHADKAINERTMVISRIEIRGGEIDVFRDRKPPFNEDQRPAMPSRLINSAPFGIYVKEVRLTETDIIYSELAEGMDEPGTVPFYDLEAVISNLSNIADSLNTDSIMQINAQAFIFGQALLRAGFSYNLKDINGGYEVSGELAELDFKAINPALYPLTGIKVADGLHIISQFYFSGNDTRSDGELYMSWSDLSLDLTPDEADVISDLTRFAGKSFLYHPSSPDDKENSPSGEIEFEREVTRFVFHYWWNCYLSGIKNSVLRDIIPF